MNDNTLIVGDIHLGKGLSIGKSNYGSLNSRILDKINLLNWILDKCDENYISNIILLGDVFEDAKPDYLYVNILIDFIKKLRQKDIDIHIIYGNHDIKRTGNSISSVLDLFQNYFEDYEYNNVHIYKSITTINIGKLSFTLIPFKDRKILNAVTHQEALDKIKNQLDFESSVIDFNNKKIILGHLTLEGSLYVGDEIDDYANEIICPLSMFDNFDYVWMGHIHKPQVLKNLPRIAHLGSLDISDFGETDHKKIVICINDNGFKEIEVPTRPLNKISISIPAKVDSTKFVLDEIKKLKLDESIVKIELKYLDLETKNVAREIIEKEILNMKASHICSFNETRNVQVISDEKQSEKLDNSVQVKSAIKKWAEKNKLSKDNYDLFLERSLAIVSEVDGK